MRALLIIWIPCLLFAQIGDDIPADRVVSWQFAGYGNNTSDVPYAKKTIRIDDSKDFLEDYSDEINNAIAQADGITLTEIYFPERIYYIEHPIIIDRNNILLRGAGPDASKIVSRGFESENDPVIQIRGKLSSSRAVEIRNIQEIEKGSRFLYVQDPLQFEPGSYAEIYQPNGSWNKKDDTWDDYSVGQIVRIEAIIGDETGRIMLQLAEEDRTRIKFADSNLSASTYIRRIIPVHNVGLEDLYINGLSYGYELYWQDKFFNIDYNYAVRCWITNVYSQRAGQAHVRINRSSEILIHGCYFRDAVHYGNGGYGYGIEIGYHSGRCLIENNIFWHLRHAMLVQLGANGNVFGYNFSGNAHPKDIGDAVCHGNYAFANLFEGNYCDMPRVDYEQDTNGPHNTYFRNHNWDYSFDSDGMMSVNWMYNLNTPRSLDNISNTFVRKTTNDFSYYLTEKPEFMEDNTWPYSPWTGTVPAWQRSDTETGNCVSVKTKPRVPKNFTLDIHNNHPRLSWVPNYENNIKNYEIWRKTSRNWIQVAAINGSEYIDNSVTTVAEHYNIHYKLQAVDSSNVKSLSTDIESVKGLVPRINALDPDFQHADPSLLPNFPNPFNPETTIRFWLPGDGMVSVEVFNYLGQCVKEWQKSGKKRGLNELKFNGTSLPSGIYFVRMSGVIHETRRPFSMLQKISLLK